MKMVKATSLVLDFHLYPRMSIDSHHVTEMAEAERAGVDFPPVLADAKSKRVVDGFHRVWKQLQVYGDDAEIGCVFKKYRSDADMFTEAMELNASHGRNLTSYDKAHCVLLAEEFKIKDDKLTAALSITIGKLDTLRTTKFAIAPGAKVTTHIPIKKTIRHMAGAKLTKRQVEANEKLGGMEQLFYVNQLIRLVEAGLLDKDNENVMEGLGKLKRLLEGIDC